MVALIRRIPSPLAVFVFSCAMVCVLLYAAPPAEPPDKPESVPVAAENNGIDQRSPQAGQQGGASDTTIEVVADGTTIPLDMAMTGTTNPTIIIRRGTDIPSNFSVRLTRPDGRAGFIGDGKALTTGPQGGGADFEEISPNVFTGPIDVLIGVNSIRILSFNGDEEYFASQWLSYSPSCEDFNGNGLLDLSEDVNDSGELEPGEDLNGNELLDFPEDENGNGQLDAQCPMPSIVPVHPSGTLVEDSTESLLYFDRTLVLDFLAGSDDAAISQFMQENSLRPIGVTIDSVIPAPMPEGTALAGSFSPKQVTVEIPLWNPYEIGDPPPVPLPLLWERYLNGRSINDSSFPEFGPVNPPLDAAIADLAADMKALDVSTERLPARLVNGAAAPPTAAGNTNGPQDRYNPAKGGFDHDDDDFLLFGTIDVDIDELNIGWYHFFMQTFAAHRLIDKIPVSPVNADAMANRPAVAVIDTGVGNGTNNLPDIDPARRYRVTDMVGPRPVTMTGAGVAFDFENIPDLPMKGRSGHGTTSTVMATGEGAMVLGVGKDVRVRPVRIWDHPRSNSFNPTVGGTFISRLALAIRELATDNNVKVINLSFGPGICPDANMNGEISGAEVAQAYNILLREERLLRPAINALTMRNTDMAAGVFRTDNDIILAVAAGNERYDAIWEWAAPQLFNMPARGLRQPNQANSQNMSVGGSDLDDATGNKTETRESSYGAANRGAQVSVSAAAGRHLRGVESNVDTTMPDVLANVDPPATTINVVGGITAAAPGAGANLAVNPVTAGIAIVDDPRFPNRGFLIIENEVIEYSAKVGNAFTVRRRGYRGPTWLPANERWPGTTDAAAHNDGTVVEIILATRAVGGGGGILLFPDDTPTPAPATTINLGGGITNVAPANGGILPVTNNVAADADYPNQGFVRVGNEIIGYGGKAAAGAGMPHRFTGVIRGLYGTTPAAAANGAAVTMTTVLPVLSTAGFPMTGLVNGNGEIIRYTGLAPKGFFGLERTYDGSDGRRFNPLDNLWNTISPHCPDAGAGVAANCPFGGNLLVMSTADFPAAGTIRVEAELMTYAGTAGGNTFTGVMRGVSQTTAEEHIGGNPVIGSRNQIRYNRTSGTSFSSPIVAGLAGELLFLDVKSDNVGILMGGNRATNFTPFQITEIIEATADDIGTGDALGPKLNTDNIPNKAPGDGPDGWFGFGRVNAWKAALTVTNGGLAKQYTEDFNGNGALDAGPDANGNSNLLGNFTTATDPNRTAEDLNGNHFPGDVGEDVNDNGALNQLFTDLPIIADGDTVWYGFEIITSEKGATAWINGEQLEDNMDKIPDPDGADPGAGNPWPLTRVVKAYKGVLSDRAILRGIKNKSANGVPLDDVLDEDQTAGVVPVGTQSDNKGQYVITFSIQRRELFDLTGGNPDPNKPRTLSLRRRNQPVGDKPFFNLRLEATKMRNGEVSGVTFDDFVFQIVAPDYGDAAIPPTKMSENGARHEDTNLEWLGKLAPAELGMVTVNLKSVTPEHNADHPDAMGGDARVDVDGVDNRHDFHDRDGRDDGVLFYPLTYKPGQQGKVEFTIGVFDHTSDRYDNDVDKSLYVNLWVDWNTNGTWDENDSEHVLNGLQLNPKLANWIVADDANPNTTTQLVQKSADEDRAEFRAMFTVPEIECGQIWARMRVDYGENAGKNDPRPHFRSLPSLRGATVAEGMPQPPNMMVGYVHGAGRFGEVEDYLIGTDFGDAPDPFTGAGMYPTLKVNMGARHLDTHQEWLGPDNNDSPNPTREIDANDADCAAAGGTDQDMRPNLDPKDTDLLRDDGVVIPPLFHGGMANIDVTVTSSVSARGSTTVLAELGPTPPHNVSSPEDEADTLPRYHSPDARRRLYLSGWADWNGDGNWATPGEKIIDSVIDPDTFGMDGAYTLGEPFTDTNWNGVRDDTENYSDLFGIDTKTFTFPVAVPLVLPEEFYFRFRLAYGENESTVDLKVKENSEDNRTNDQDKGGALFGEVEDYRGMKSISCGPGEHWVDGCGAGVDSFETEALVQIDLDLDCLPDATLELSGPVSIRRSTPADQSANFPDAGSIDDHLDVIDAEIVSMTLTGGGVTLIAGAGLGQGGVLPPVLGAIVEQSGNSTLADSFFDVRFEVELDDGTYVYNHVPHRVTAVIPKVPPKARYLLPISCLELYDSPVVGRGFAMATVPYVCHGAGTPCYPPYCGDGYINAGEECDPPGSETCADGGTCQKDCTCVSIPYDRCINRILLPGSGNFPFDTTGAATDGSAHPGVCQFDGQTYEDIWFNYVAECDSSLVVSTCQEDGGDAFYDSDLVVYGPYPDCLFAAGDCPPDGADLLGCNDDATKSCTASGTTYASRVTVPVIEGQCYKLRVGGFSAGVQGAGILAVHCEDSNCGNGILDPGEQCDPPGSTTCSDGGMCRPDCTCSTIPNDDCANRILLPGGGDHPFSTIGASTDGLTHPFQCQFGGQTYEDIWFNYVAECDSSLVVSTCQQEGGDAFYDTDLVVYGPYADCSSASIDCPPDDFDLLGCNDDATSLCTASGTPYASRVIVPVLMGNCYKIRVGGWTTDVEGFGVLSVDCTASGCGNNITDPGEECDDGNTDSNDGCDANCQLEGACCNVLDGACTNFQSSDGCSDFNESYQGDGTVCGAPAACCLSTGECVFIDTVCCSALGGLHQESDSGCSKPRACCLTDGSCINADPLCCLNVKGLPQGFGSVCTGAEACCFPDGSCQNLDPVCCADQFGSPQGAGSACEGDGDNNGTDDACEEEPIPQACCLPNPNLGILDCVELTIDMCMAQGGLPLGPDMQCQPAVGCCITGDPAGQCFNTDERCCAFSGGSPQALDCTASRACCRKDGECVDVDGLCCDELGGTSHDGACGSPEACCLPEGECVMVDRNCCAGLGGTWQGFGSACTAPETACCLPDGACLSADPLCCDELGGATQGTGTMCVDPQACCLADGSCAVLAPACCQNLSGTPLGSGSQCLDESACCFLDGSCADIDRACCANQGGVSAPKGIACLGDSDQDGYDDRCEPESCLPDHTGQGCLPFNCPNPNEVCVPSQIVCDKGFNCEVVACDCADPGLCHVGFGDLGAPQCVGNCPEGEICNQNTTILPDGRFLTECVCEPAGCAPLPDGSACNTFDCGGLDPSCVPSLVRCDVTGHCRIEECQCANPDDCHVEITTTTDIPGAFCQGSCIDRLVCELQSTVEPDGSTVAECQCVEPAQACCRLLQECAILPPTECLLQLGTPLGPGTICGPPAPCCIIGDTSALCFQTDGLCCSLHAGVPQSPAIGCSMPEACCLAPSAGGGCVDVDPLCCDEFDGTPQGSGTTCDDADVCALPEPPVIVHASAMAGETQPHSGYIDPRRESNNGAALNQGLTSTLIRFSEPVLHCNGTPFAGAASAAAFVMTETGGAAPPAVTSVSYFAGDQAYVRVSWNRPITPRQWTTIIVADACNAAVIPVPSMGNLGPMNEPDRVDIAFLPANVDQNNNVNPLDLLRFKQYVNGLAVPPIGTLLMYVDMDRNGLINPLDLLSFKRLVNGISPATQSWSGGTLLNPRP